MYNMFASTNNLNYIIDGGSKQRNGWNFQWGLDLVGRGVVEFL